MKRYNYGGQAVVEGVMMRGRRSAAVAVRLASGNILLHEEQLSKRLYASKVSQWPFVRGLLLLWDMLILGTRMMMFAATASLAPASAGSEESAPSGVESVESGGALAGQATITEATPRDMQGIGGAGMTLTLVVSLAFAIGLFFVLNILRLG